MVQNAHRILRASFEVGLSDRDQALAIPDKLSLLFHNTLTPALNKVLNPMCGPGDTLQIDFLEISLGTINLDKEDEILEVFTNRLTEQLSRLAVKKKVTSIPNDKAAFKHLLHFLEYGHLPWNAPYSTFDQLVSLLSAKEHWELDFVRTLGTLLLIHAAKKRLFYQANPIFLKRLAKELAGYCRLKDLNSNRAVSSSENPVETINYYLGILEAQDQTEKDLEDSPKMETESYKTETDLTSQDPTGKDLEDSPKMETEAYKAEKDLEDSPKMETESYKAETDLIPVQNCGIVLFNPVLTPLFKELGLLKNSNFISENAREKAVFVLHYLATGSHEVGENEAVIYKVLCGMPLYTPIPRKKELSKTETALCAEAIQSIITEWSALKNTSIDGLRENFICRDGNLTIGEGRFDLMVEQRSIDVLLSYSPPPWTVGIISQPWMTNALFVNWF